MVAGGYQQKSAYFYNKAMEKWIRGPSLRAKRDMVACGKGKARFRTNVLRTIIIAAGGLSGSSRLKSTEVLFGYSKNPKVDSIMSLIVYIVVQSWNSILVVCWTQSATGTDLWIHCCQIGWNFALHWRTVWIWTLQCHPGAEMPIGWRREECFI